MTARMVDLFEVRNAQLDNATAMKVVAILGHVTYEVIGWGVVDVGERRFDAIVVSQAWPVGLPFGTDPWKLKKARRAAAIFAFGNCLDVVEVQLPESDPHRVDGEA